MSATIERVQHRNPEFEFDYEDTRTVEGRGEVRVDTHDLAALRLERCLTALTRGDRHAAGDRLRGGAQPARLPPLSPRSGAARRGPQPDRAGRGAGGRRADHLHAGRRPAPALPRRHVRHGGAVRPAGACARCGRGGGRDRPRAQAGRAVPRLRALRGQPAHLLRHLAPQPPLPHPPLEARPYRPHPDPDHRRTGRRSSSAGASPSPT